MKKSITACCALIVLSACNQPYDAPRYENKTLTPKLIAYSDWKKDKDTAYNEVASGKEAYAKSACRHVGVGWMLKEIKSPGEIECEESPEGHRCRNKDIVLECRKINER